MVKQNFIKAQEFDDIRPYYEEEAFDAMQRIADSESFPLLASYVYPGKRIDDVRRQIRNFHSIRDFQLEVMRCVNEQIISRSITKFTYSGVENLSSEKKYTFVSNHRDIMLDACLLQYVLYKNGHETSEISFGANLMLNQLITDIGKSNKMFKVERPGMNPREFYKYSLHLSKYIRYALKEKHESIWIAQRNGRTKDGVDRTDHGVIKMFGMSYQGDKVDALAELNIVPVSVSYEWESCDILKALELYQSRREKYTKKPNEDLNSILTGILQPKGHVHFEFCDVVGKNELLQLNNCTEGVFYRNVVNLLDKRICSAYKLHPNNYIAHDLRYGKNEYGERYTHQEKDVFLNHMKQLSKYKDVCEIDELMDIFLGIYSNPIESTKIYCK